MDALALLAWFAAGRPQAAVPQAETPPVVSVWYRGTPEGVPKLDDLAAIRAAGFTGVTWPASQTAGQAALKLMAASVDLAVVAGPDLRVPVSAAVPSFNATVWRAIAHGTRIISFDPGQKTGTGFTSRTGERLPWVRPAAAIAAQVSANPRLIASLRPGPPVRVEASSRGLDVVLLDAGRAWVLIATSTAPADLRAVARLPAGVPYALWVSLLDGGTMSMLRQSSGPRWTFTIAAGDALVYVIDKTLK
jgi:hypothetical protein